MSATRPEPSPITTAWRAGEISDPRHVAPRLPGRNYLRLMAAAHRELRPGRYFEIGTNTGASLALSACPSVAVDPRFRLPEGFMDDRPHVQLFETTSDEFFASHDLSACLGGPVDLAFLDGMHRFEFLLRDFMNTEAHCTAGSAIMLHDCVPFSSQIVHRDQRGPRLDEFNVLPNAWAGDVWKMLPILRTWRPDLRLAVFNAGPTGLVFVTGLDPASTVLRAAYEEIVERYMALDIVSIGVSAFVAQQGMLRTAEGLAPGRLKTLIGLPVLRD